MDLREPQDLIQKIYNDTSFTLLVDRIKKSDFPVETYETENSYLAYLLSALKKKDASSFFVVLPTDQEAENFVSDLVFLGPRGDASAVVALHGIQADSSKIPSLWRARFSSEFTCLQGKWHCSRKLSGFCHLRTFRSAV